MIGEPSDIRIVKVKRSGGRETETKLVTCHGIALNVDRDNGEVTIEAYPSGPRGDGLRIYIGKDSATAVLPYLKAWARITHNG